MGELPVSVGVRTGQTGLTLGMGSGRIRAVQAKLLVIGKTQGKNP